MLPLTLASAEFWMKFKFLDCLTEISPQRQPLDMLGKRKSTASAPPSKKRKKSTPAIEEITFDFNARENYLTGFHKRKLQRIKHAQEEAAKKDREERIVARKTVS